MGDWGFADAGAPNAVRESLTCRLYTDFEGLIELLCMTGGAICAGELLEDVAGVLLTRLRRNTTTPKSNNPASNTKPTTMTIQSMEELSAAGWSGC